MCDTVLIPCNKDHTASGGTDVIDVITGLWKACKFTWKVAKFTGRQTVDFAIGLAVIAVWLYRATRWTVRTIRRGYRWYVTLPVNRGQRQPVAAIAVKPADPETAWTLADLRLKEPANR